MTSALLDPREVAPGAVKRWSTQACRLIWEAPLQWGAVLSTLVLIDGWAFEILSPLNTPLALLSAPFMALQMLILPVLFVLMRCAESGWSLERLALLKNARVGVVCFVPLLLIDASLSFWTLEAEPTAFIRHGDFVRLGLLLLFSILTLFGSCAYALVLYYGVPIPQAYSLGQKAWQLNVASLSMSGFVIPLIILMVSLAGLPTWLLVVAHLYLIALAYAAFRDVFEHQEVQKKPMKSLVGSLNHG